MNYRRLPVQVQALQWTGDNIDFIKEFLLGADKTIVQEVNGDLKLMSLDGYMTAHKKDYIILNRHGECYPCNKRSFDEIYEAV